jgi:hypothetical protein
VSRHKRQLAQAFLGRRRASLTRIVAGQLTSQLLHEFRSLRQAGDLMRRQARCSRLASFAAPAAISF